ncbi:Gfo/Idh/MocA family oxidoreductase [Trinickia mobilis]|uniref:Gfo/Idh/MocA family oxidoreductase n=1 Tax=Trinickia mobilis TaxID=2816356 RepID=UPI001A8D3A5A|nr:Gfo/Idh/MocA family oxidoreductase [Trinickia mobilis]
MTSPLGNNRRNNRRVLVAGAKFGELYLNAFMRAQDGLELAGLLANGSARSQQLAHAFGIPLYTSPEQVPGDTDIVCVVVRSSVAGGAGTALAETFLQRGMHVVQEHPLHPDDVMRLQALAVRQGLAYWVNSFYAHTPAGLSWIECARRVRRVLDGAAPCFAHAMTSRQLLYSSLDLLSQAYGATGAELDQAEIAALDDDDPAFQTLRLRLARSNAALRLQTYVDPLDPDLHSLAMHHMAVGWPSGYLSLQASYGPVLWSPALHDPRHRTAPDSMYRRVAAADAGTGDAWFAQPTALTLHAAAPDWQSALEVDGPAGVAHVLQALRRHLDGGATPSGFGTAYQSALARLWQRTLRCAGAAAERELAPPRAIAAHELLGARREETAA